MSNTVITNYTDLNGPSTKADSSVVVIVNKDGSLSVDENLLGTLMGSDGSQGAGISVVRVGHEGKPDDATDESDSEDDKVPHVTLSVDSYFDEPNSVLKYDSGAEMLQSFRIETRENSLLGFQNDHCYTLISPADESQRSDRYAGYDDPIIEIKQQSPPKNVPSSKKITILEQKIIPKGRKIPVPADSGVILKGKDLLNKPLPLGKSKKLSSLQKSDENTESSSISSSGDSIPDRDSDSDYKDVKDKTSLLKKSKAKPRILKHVIQPGKGVKLDPKVASRLKSNKNVLKQEIKDKLVSKGASVVKSPDANQSINESSPIDAKKATPKLLTKVQKKEKKTPSHISSLLSEVTTLFSTPDVIRRVSADNKSQPSKDATPNIKTDETPKGAEKQRVSQRSKQKSLLDKNKVYDLIPQIDEVSLAQILQDPTPVPAKVVATAPNAMNSPSLAGPLSPTLDLLGGLQPEEEGLTEDLLMHVAQLVESSENLQEVIDKQVLGKVDTVTAKASTSSAENVAFAPGDNLYTPSKSAKSIAPRKDPIEIVRKDGRVITLPPIEAPATRSSKRKSQIESTPSAPEVVPPPAPIPVAVTTPVTSPEAQVPQVSKQYMNKRLVPKTDDDIDEPTEKSSAESMESWNSEDDPNRLWCICRQPHNNRFMICCDGCEDWFHGKCVNITKAMGQQMEEQGMEWRCPNCVKKAKTPKLSQKLLQLQRKHEMDTHPESPSTPSTSKPNAESKGPSLKTTCIVCKKPARASSIYCSDSCILKHAQDSLGSPSPTKPGDDKLKGESRVIVYERKTGRCLAGPNAPTAENLKAWLQKNPTFEVVRPGTLSTIKPNLPSKKTNEQGKIQTTLNFERVPRKSGPAMLKVMKSPQEQSPKATPVSEIKSIPPRTAMTPRSLPMINPMDSPKPSTSTAKPSPIEKKPIRATTSRSMSNPSKASPSPSTSRKKDTPEPRKPTSGEPIRDNVRKALQEQMTLRMAENKGPKFTAEEIREFAVETEAELHNLFRDVGVKYKAKYRSLMFNIKDRKNLSLWQKICDKTITPKQLVRLSPEELASQELAQWRDKEAKHQLELIKKSELDLLAASKTYVLKTHKGEEVMETKTSMSTELDPNVAVEDLVTALNDSTAEEPEVAEESPKESRRSLRISSSESGDKRASKRKDKSKDPNESVSKKSTRESKREESSRSSRSSKSTTDTKKEERPSRRSERRSSKTRTSSKDRSRREPSKEKEAKDKVSSKDKSSSRDTRSSAKTRSSQSHSRSKSKERETKGRERSRSRSKRRSRSKQRSRSRDNSKRRRSSRSKRRPSKDDKTRSKSQEAAKTKNDSTDSDSIERPKSAMLEEAHPEYDPHEPMITSAFSEEDLTKSREDVYEESKNEVVDYGKEFEAKESFTLVTKTSRYPKRDKPSEPESDQEPTSTVDNAGVAVWNGCINMEDVARFYVAAHEVSGNGAELEEDLNAVLDIVGRINPDTVWDYIGKMKRTSNKDIVVLRLEAANDEEKMQYFALYSYLSSRNRLGVVKVTNTTSVKDFYIVPLPANSKLPSVLLPFEGPGLEEVKNHLLIAIVVKLRKKRGAAHIPAEVVPAKMTRVTRNRRSFTPPAPSGRAPPTHYASPTLTTTVKSKIAPTIAPANDEDEPYSPGSSSNDSAPRVAGSTALRTKMEELNRQIAEQKRQILNMTQRDSGGDDEAYSPSRPMTPPSPPASAVPLADISLPSNLQEILATIKQRSETVADVDMRTKPT